MAKVIKKLRHLVAELKAVSAEALKESERLVARIDQQIAKKAETSRAKRAKRSKAPRKGR
jgi:uncharacterized membrane protein